MLTKDFIWHQHSAMRWAIKLLWWQGLTDRSRRPYRYAHQLPFQLENYILNVKREHTSWGCP
jgi:hypothetical protein